MAVQIEIVGRRPLKVRVDLRFFRYDRNNGTVLTGLSFVVRVRIRLLIFDRLI